MQGAFSLRGLKHSYGFIQVIITVATIIVTKIRGNLSVMVTKKLEMG